MGEALYNPKKMLPLLLKDSSDLSNEELWGMGLLIADGSLSKTNQLSITLNRDDTETLVLLREALQIKNSVKPVMCNYRDKKTGQVRKIQYSRLTWGYRYATPYWKELGLIQEKTSNEIWLPYMANSHFLRGFLDGDGSCSSTRITFTGGSYSFLKHLQDFIDKVIHNQGNLSFSKGAWNLGYSGQYALRLGLFLYEDSGKWRMERKYENFLLLKQTVEKSLENGVHTTRLTHGGVLGGKASKEYRAWQGIKRSCYNLNSPSYRWFGAKGITA